MEAVRRGIGLVEAEVKTEFKVDPESPSLPIFYLDWRIVLRTRVLT